jgi:hypothetical protein
MGSCDGRAARFTRLFGPSSVLARTRSHAAFGREARSRGPLDYLLVELTGVSELLPVAEPRLGRRMALTFPLLPPPQKN